MLTESWESERKKGRNGWKVSEREREEGKAEENAIDREIKRAAAAAVAAPRCSIWRSLACLHEAVVPEQSSVILPVVRAHQSFYNAGSRCRRFRHWRPFYRTNFELWGQSSFPSRNMQLYPEQHRIKLRTRARMDHVSSYSDTRNKRFPTPWENS